jgi:hypothetical protein
MSVPWHRLHPIPYYYSKKELEAYKKTPEESIAPYLDKPIIHTDIHRAFETKAEALRKELQTPLIQLGFPVHFTDQMAIYTKKDLDQVLQRAIKWFNSQNIDTYIFITETAQQASPKENASPRNYKSSDWLPKLFVHHTAAHSIQAPVRLLDESVIDYDEDAFSKITEDTFVIIDDGIYSGSQKESIVGSFIQKRTQPFRLYVLPLFWTKDGLQRITNIVQSLFDTKTMDIHPGKEIRLSSNRLFSKSRVSIWTGGVEMKTIEQFHFSKALLNKLTLTSYDPKTKAFYLNEERQILNIDEIGKTMCVFEHKIPDYLSLVPFIGDYYEDQMASHYQYNPPYKKIMNVKNR